MSSSAGSPTTRPGPEWAGPVTGVGAINAFIRRLRSSLRPLRPIIRADLTGTPRRQISTQDQQVTVVDLHNLHERAQRFVVGVVLAAETARKEERRPGRAAVHDDQRAEQVRPPGRHVADQGGAAGAVDTTAAAGRGFLIGSP